MKNIIITIILILNAGFSYSQNKETTSILYSFPDSVNVAIKEGVKLSNLNCDTCFIINLSHCDTDFCIEIKPLNRIKPNLMKYVKLTNRYAMIKGKQIPVIVDFDMEFIEDLNAAIGNTGGGYTIRFDLYGKIIYKNFQN